MNLTQIRHLPRLASLLIALLTLTGLSHAADTYKVDNVHSHLGFAVKHMVIAKVYGQFQDYTGTLQVEDGAIQKGEFVIQAASIDTDNDKRDGHLRNEDFFHVDEHPTLTYTIKKVEQREDQTVLIGDFTMRGTTKTLELPVTVLGPIKDPWGNTRLGLTGSTTINRMDYGVDYDSNLPGGQPSVSHEVELIISVEAVKQ